MWNRRDYGILAAAALATFGLTVGAFWPRVANAVDDKPAATTEVKVPTLALGKVQVTAAFDKVQLHAVVLTVKNTSDQGTSASFKAIAQVTPPVSPFSRGIRISQPAWQSDYALDLKPGEVKAFTVNLPDAAFNVPVTPPQDAKVPEALRTVAGRSELVLSTSMSTKLTTTNDQIQTNIVALVLATGSPAAPAGPVQATARTLTNVVSLAPNGDVIRDSADMSSDAKTARAAQRMPMTGIGPMRPTDI